MQLNKLRYSTFTEKPEISKVEVEGLAYTGSLTCFMNRRHGS